MTTTRTTTMTFDVDVEHEGTIKVRIEEGQIKEVKVFLTLGGRRTYQREEKDRINDWFKKILEEDVEAFKKILRNIEEDADFFFYNKSLLDTERESAEQKLLASMKGFTTILEEMQKEVDKYTL